jgi:cysteinyl-tRNA synthetase
MMKRLGRYMMNLPEVSDERNTHGKMKFHDISREFRDNQQAFMQDFIEKLEDDFDTNTAMTIVFEYQSYINAGIDDDLFSLEESKSIIALLRSWDEVLSLFDFILLEDTEIIPNEIQALGADRAEAKMQKNWAEADRIRDELLEL